MQFFNGALSAANQAQANSLRSDYLKAGAAGTQGQDFGQHSFLSIILPYLEQGNVLAQSGVPYNYHLDWFALPNRPAGLTRIPTY